MAKIAIVTGASRGLGRNTALHIARGGGDVILTYQSRADETIRQRQRRDRQGQKERPAMRARFEVFFFGIAAGRKPVAQTSVS